MAKINIKTEKNKTFKGIFHVKELFSSYVCSNIDKVLGFEAFHRVTNNSAGASQGW